MPKKLTNTPTAVSEVTTVPAVVEAEEPRELTTAEKFYITSHIESLHADEIASDLGVSSELVKQVIDDSKDKTKPKDPTMFERSLAKKKHGKGGAVIMTEGASEHIDEAYKNNKPTTMDRHVFRPKGNN